MSAKNKEPAKNKPLFTQLTKYGTTNTGNCSDSIHTGIRTSESEVTHDKNINVELFFLITEMLCRHVLMLRLKEQKEGLRDKIYDNFKCYI